MARTRKAFGPHASTLRVSESYYYVQNDFSDAATLTNIFNQHNVWAVISCLLVADEPMYTAQETAINAAEKSASTTRFIASNWANPSDG